MKRYLFTLAIFLLGIILGCQPTGQKKDVVARVNDYEITKDKFEQEFKDSIYGGVDTLESRQKFLDSLIDRKLILQDAQRQGLDKKEGFLNMIERFWEQSLLKIALDKKTQEIDSSTMVSEEEMQALYAKKLEDGMVDRSYEEMREQLRREITKSKELAAMNQWIAKLHKEAKVTINQELIK